MLINQDLSNVGRVLSRVKRASDGRHVKISHPGCRVTSDRKTDVQARTADEFRG